jgi:hypothetical protein
MGHIMTHSNSPSLGLKQIFNILMRMLASVATIAAASAALFWVGFHVIPVFADKAPQIFIEQEVPGQLLLTQQTKPSIPTSQFQAAEKKTLP